MRTKRTVELGINLIWSFVVFFVCVFVVDRVNNFKTFCPEANWKIGRIRIDCFFLFVLNEKIVFVVFFVSIHAYEYAYKIICIMLLEITLQEFIPINVT